MSRLQRSISRPLTTRSGTQPRQTILTHEEHFIPASPLSAVSTLSEHFSSFVSLAAGVMEDEIAHGSDDQANFMRNMRDHDLGLWNNSTRPLGEGATFIVRRFIDGGESIGAVDERIAIKSLRLAYSTQQSQVEHDKKSLASALLELRILTHKRVRACENIVRLLGIGWETDAVIFDRKWPALLVEYADHGTLADLFESQSVVPPTLKWHLCLDVARALEVLHDLKVVHGDIKLLNVLLFSNPLVEEGPYGRPVIAKLADFGGALLDMEVLVALPSGTFPWNAPESAQLMQRNELLWTDVYSFGMLVWQIWLDGVNPFIAPGAPGYSQALADNEIEAEKNDIQFYRKVRDSVERHLNELEIQEFGDILHLFDCALPLEPSQRDLKKIIHLLESKPIAAART